MTKFDHKTFLSKLSSRPGVYRMLDEAGDILYVGKAKNLKNRVSSYFRSSALDGKTMALVVKINRIETTVTSSETEALLLEQSLIKELKPPYNIVFRDDKSYPYIFLSANEDYPRLAFHRGAQKAQGRYFGPFPSAYSVRDSLHLMQKIFKVRQCEDTFFRNRSRPCLQYQINRCSGPCCGLISTADYADDVEHAQMFLEGKNHQILEDYANRMEEAAARLEYEEAAAYRDQISHLRKIQEQQYVVGKQGDVDVLAALCQPMGACVLVMFIRGGRLLGNKTYFPRSKLDADEAAVLDAFIPQFYLMGAKGRDIPQEIVVNNRLENKVLLQRELEQVAGRKVSLSDNVRGHRSRWLKLALANAEQSLGARVSSKQTMAQRFESLRQCLQLDEVPGRLECFDISHSAGEATVASCVVFDQNGPLKADYRRFNIEGVAPGDDYGAMAQAIKRRYTRLKKSEAQYPDVLFIDGGKGQLHQVEKALAALEIDGILLVAVAKGPERRAGMEKLHTSVGGEFGLDANDPGLNLIQHIRDESHRFALTAHRQRRGKKRTTSPLEKIGGVGPKRRRSLLRHFGGTQQVAGASVDELSKVQGINQKLAVEIYDSFHNG